MAKRYSGDERITIRVNGEEHSVVIEPMDTLLQVLRDAVGLTGTKLGCENGDCGACTVLVDGVPTKSCYTLVLDVADAEITTIEGLRDTPIQQAFVAEYGFQCGFCTPGFVMNATALLKRGGGRDADENREWLESNICRCTGYETIERAVRRAAGEQLPPLGTD
jgi:carbon-monoxide dehydrogenase small subunit